LKTSSIDPLASLRPVCPSGVVLVILNGRNTLLERINRRVQRLTRSIDHAAILIARRRRNAYRVSR
jgi:hypothetical protein